MTTSTAQASAPGAGLWPSAAGSDVAGDGSRDDRLGPLMGETTEIAWADSTWNPWWGCARVSPACAECYAESFARRLGLDIWGKTAARRFFGDEHWSEPLRWNRKAERAGTPRTVFCASMADVFEDRAELRPHRDRLWELIEATRSLRWLLLTKRPENMVAMAPWGAGEWPAHVWPGTTTENRRWAAVRVPYLQGVDAAVRFLSVEPLLEDIADDLDLDGISWVIVGGESGPKARPTHPLWARKLRDRCQRQGVRYFFKQWGHWAPLGDSRPTAHPGTCVHVDGTTCGGAVHDRSGPLEPTVMFPVGKKAAGRQLDGRTWDELPAERPLLGLIDQGGGHRRVGRTAPKAADNRNEGPGL